MAEPFVHRMRVRYAECDAQGVLFNAHYLAYIDHSITEMWRAAYGGYDRMLQRGVDVVVAEAQLQFLEGARFDQEIDAEMLVTHLGTTSMRSHHRMVRVQDGAPLMEADDFSRKVAELEIDLTALEFTELRTLAEEAKGHMAGPESSILKIKGTEIQQRITELVLEAVGYYAFPDARAFGDNEYLIGPENALGAADIYFNMRKASIYGGSNEIQRNIIAKAVLGL